MDKPPYRVVLTLDELRQLELQCEILDMVAAGDVGEAACRAFLARFTIGEFHPTCAYLERVLSGAAQDLLAKMYRERGAARQALAGNGPAEIPHLVKTDSSEPGYEKMRAALAELNGTAILPGMTGVEEHKMILEHLGKKAEAEGYGLKSFYKYVYRKPASSTGRRR